MSESEPDPKLEGTETGELTETDPFKPHEGVPRQDEHENVKEPGHRKEDGAKILKESVEAKSSFGELASAERDLQLAAVCPSRHGCPSRHPAKHSEAAKTEITM